MAFAEQGPTARKLLLACQTRSHSFRVVIVCEPRTGERGLLPVAELSKMPEDAVGGTGVVGATVAGSFSLEKFEANGAKYTLSV